MHQKKENCTIGVDVSKQKLDIWILPKNEHFVINNNVRDIGKIFKSLSKTSKVILEPTGGYEKLLVQKLIDYDVESYVVHPYCLYHFAKGKGFVAKTDKISSKQLALYLQEKMQVKELNSMTKIDGNYKKVKRLQELSSRRQQLKASLLAEKNRSEHNFFNKEIKNSTKRLISCFKRELGKIEQVIQKEIDEVDELKQKQKILETFVGVGSITSTTLLLEVSELGSLTRQEIAKLVGVAPINADSGKTNESRIRGGRSQARKVLYMAALVAIRHNEEAKAIYERLKENGKMFKVAIVAVMRKILCILNSMLKKNVTWQEFRSLGTAKKEEKKTTKSRLKKLCGVNCNAQFVNQSYGRTIYCALQEGCKTPIQKGFYGVSFNSIQNPVTDVPLPVIRKIILQS